ncbi:MAG: hypothetical protein M3174_06635 [Actinomycetota bacterium]|nr:hypothetical protein [Actinomycetota bacterium]
MSPVEQPRLPEWEHDLIDEAIRAAEQRREAEKTAAKKRAVQLAREKAYHRLAVAIDRPERPHDPRQLRLFPTDPTLFDDAG